MSYDICFRVKVEGIDQYVDIGNCDANITWNVRDIIMKSTGLEWKNEENNGYCKDIIPCIERGLRSLIDYPDVYRPLEPSNGWGTVDGVIRFFRQIIDDWRHLKRDYGPEIANVTTFWIV